MRFALRGMVSLVDGVPSRSGEGGGSGGGLSSSPFADPAGMHRDVMLAFDSLSTFLRGASAVLTPASAGGATAAGTSRLGLPLRIDAVEPLAPCLRYSDPFPPSPHPLLGGTTGTGSTRKAAGAIVGAPALLQIRFEGSSKWPSDLDAMGAAKCAMLIQLAGGIERMRRNGDKEACGFDGPMRATPTYLDLGYRGYSWRIMIRADRELRMLGSLRDPTPAARSLRTVRQLLFLLLLS